MNDKTKKIVGWVLTGLVGALFLFSAFSKITSHEEAVKGLSKMNMAYAIKGIGIAELICAILFIIPRTGVLGTVLLIGYMGGTIAAHIAVNEPIVSNIVIGVVVGLVGYFRFPELGKRLFTGQG